MFENPGYDPFTFNFGSDLLFALHKVGPSLDAINPDLRPLERRGSKLIVYHGFSDPDISPLNSINYFESVASFMAHRGDDREDASPSTLEAAASTRRPASNAACRAKSGETAITTITTMTEAS